MTRLPNPGGDAGDWGDILNSFLEVAHNSDGSLKKSAYVAAGGYVKPQGGIPLGDLDSPTQASVAKAATSVQTVNTNTPDGSGNVTIAASDVGAIAAPSGPADGQVLTFDGTSGVWVAATASTGASGSAAPSVLGQWRLAVARMRAGTADARMLWVGDSTTSGYGSGTEPPALASAPSCLVDRLNAAGWAPTADGLAMPPCSPDSDPRWTVGSGWSNYPAYGYAGFGSWFAESASGALVFADPRITADSFDVYYACLSGFGTLTISATGGSAVVVDTSSGTPNTVQKATATAAEVGPGNAVSLTASGDVVVIGVEPFDSTKRRVRIGNAGRNSSTAAEWTSNDLGIGSLGAIAAYSPDLSVLSLGINDAVTPVAVDIWMTQMETLIQACQASGDVLLWTPQVVNDATREANLALYRAQYPALAQQYGCGLVDVYSRHTTWDSAWYFDNYHLNGLGYLDMADAFIAAVTT